MLVKLLKSTKYKGKMLFPGTHDVIQKSAKEWIKNGMAKEVKEAKKTSDDTAKTVKTQTDIMNEGQLAELQAVAKELEIDIEDKSYEELLEEVELAKDLNSEE